MALQLSYTITPDSVSASLADADPSVVSLQVMVSNPGTSAVAMHEVTIEIPVGAEAAGALSAIPSLPPPEYGGGLPVTITSAGSTVTIAGTSGSFDLATSLVFTLPGIPVNEVAGTVYVAITEFPASGGKVEDPEGASITKLPANDPVTRFWAEPATLADLDEPVVLYWSVTEQGKEYVYSLRSDDGWSSGDCVGGGKCLQWEDGVAGVKTPPLLESTTFMLDVVGMDEDGARVVEQTLTTSVRVEVPSISSESYLTQYALGSGRLVRLYWAASNASRCVVKLGTATIDDHAPTDTYHSGYTVVVDGAPGQYQLSVTAVDESGSAHSTFTFPLFQVADPPALAVGELPQQVAFVPGGGAAFVTQSSSGTLTRIDSASGAVKTSVVTGIPGAFGIAITPDGGRAVVGSTAAGAVTVVDLAAGVPEYAVPAGSQPWLVAVTPDGARAVVSQGSGTHAWVLDLALRMMVAEPYTGQRGGVPAVTPDGALALVPSQGTSTLATVDLATLAAGSPIAAGAGPFAVAITPDGALALVTDSASSSVAVIDLATRALEPASIPVGPGCAGIAITPDGRYALVANTLEGTVSVIDVPGRAALAGKIPVGEVPTGIAVALVDGALVAYVTNQAAASVSVI